MPVQEVILAINSTIDSILSCSLVYLQDITPGQQLPLKHPIGLENMQRRLQEFLWFYNIIFYYTPDQSLPLSSASSLLDYVLEQSYVTMYLSRKVHNSSAGIKSGITGSCSAATCSPLSFSPWHLSLHPTSGKRSGLPWHSLWHTIWNHALRTSGE